jgi:glycine betaine/proline transport system permease protein
VLLAIVLDRLTETFGVKSKKRRPVTKVGKASTTETAHS